MAIDYFFDNQIRRYLIQVTRVFGQFSWESTINGQLVTKMIPSTLASQNFNVAAITTNNTDVFTQTTPQFSTYLRDIQMDPEARQTPNFERFLQVTERGIDDATGEYTSNVGNRYTVQSYMPVPYRMLVTVYLWTSNFNQKCQIMEQVMAIFNPSVTLQSNTNPIDWTSLTSLEMTSVQWTNNSYPLANQNTIELATMEFSIPIWINAPSKIKKQKLIQKIISNMGQMENLITDTVGDLWSDPNELLGRVCVTYDDYGVILLDGNKVKLVNGDNGKFNNDGTLPDWSKLVDESGLYVKDRSEIVLTYDYDDVDVEIAGLFYYTNETNVVDIIFSQMPTSTYTINGIIDPEATNPTNKLKNAIEGDTYLILSDINNEYGFNSLVAKTNDLIYFDGDNWLVKYSPIDNIVIYNERSSKYYVWTNKHWEDIFSGTKKNIKWQLRL